MSTRSGLRYAWATAGSALPRNRARTNITTGTKNGGRPLLAFPFGKHDDQVDNVSQFLKWAWNDWHRPRVALVAPEAIEIQELPY